MSSVTTDQIKNIGKKVMLLGKEYANIMFQWQLKTLKTQRYKIQKKLAERKLNGILTKLGTEFYYGAVKENKNTWNDIESIKEAIESLKLSEENIAKFDHIIEELEKQYAEKKMEIKERYGSLREDLSQKPDAEGE